jgi:hypothetical protein
MTPAAVVGEHREHRAGDRAGRRRRARHSLVRR